MSQFLLFNIGQMLTMRGGGVGPLQGAAMAAPETLSDAAVFVNQGFIADVGPSQDMVLKYPDVKQVDANGAMVTPGLVDPHTHLVHGGSREFELEQKLAGVPYLEILAQGGGILRTVEATKQASHEELTVKARDSLRIMNALGVTTVEAKSGYGLEWPTEQKQLQVVQRLKETQPVRLVSTFLGAHAVPPVFKNDSDRFVDAIIEMLPEAKSMAEFCDVFCEQGVFSVQQSERLLTAARDFGFGLKIHADEIISLGGAGLAARLGAVSADHLIAASDEDLGAMATAGVIAVVLPGTSWNLGKTPARARAMIDNHGLAVAVATDYNPGSCPTENLQLVMSHATQDMKMRPNEVFVAVTRNAAYAIGRGRVAGQIEVGRPADLVLWNAKNPAYVCYHFGINHVNKVWIDGELVVEQGVATWN